MKFILISIFLLITTTLVEAGPILAVFCISACNAGYVSCCAGLGVVAGTVSGGIGAPLAIAACSAAQSACMIACAAAPTP
ncbi:hypothetical protein AKO1_005445 [Acrasis kona]|uniref:Uncharacterized protein n=1 Tax=Acrasis kona TaxID=1008807 RepID=A0AAW2YJU4_9EUKA